jgi:hypothetical protein
MEREVSQRSTLRYFWKILFENNSGHVRDLCLNQAQCSPQRKLIGGDFHGSEEKEKSRKEKEVV